MYLVLPVWLSPSKGGTWCPSEGPRGGYVSSGTHQLHALQPIDAAHSCALDAGTPAATASFSSTTLYSSFSIALPVSSMLLHARTPAHIITTLHYDYLSCYQGKKKKNYSFLVSQSGGTCMSMFLKFSHNLLTEAMRQFSTVFQVDQHNAQFLGFSNENLKKFYVKWWDKFNFERIVAQV